MLLFPPTPFKRVRRENKVESRLYLRCVYYITSVVDYLKWLIVFNHEHQRYIPNFMTSGLLISKYSREQRDLVFSNLSWAGVGGELNAWLELDLKQQL